MLMPSKSMSKASWEERKREYLEHLGQSTDRGYLLVSCADKLHNARAILQDCRAVGDSVWDRFTDMMFTVFREDEEIVRQWIDLNQEALRLSGDAKAMSALSLFTAIPTCSWLSPQIPSAGHGQMKMAHCYHDEPWR